MLDPVCETARADSFGGVKAARIQAVQQTIDRNLTDPRLSAARVGATLGVSERYVQRLLSDLGTSFRIWPGASGWSGRA